MKTINEFDNGLLKRKEVEVSDKYESNPGFDKSRKDISVKFKVGEDLVSIKKIESSFGSDEFVIKAFIYDSVESKNIIEPKKKEKKNA